MQVPSQLTGDGSVVYDLSKTEPTKEVFAGYYSETVDWHRKRSLVSGGFIKKAGH